MDNQVTREKILERLKTVEHPEIAVSLVDLGMIIDVAVKDNIASVAIALPMLNIPQAVANAILQSIAPVIKEFGLTFRAAFFEMTPDVRDNFFTAARANWKGSI
jgi:metal-sulfur cluster biosynthetic enzyme